MHFAFPGLDSCIESKTTVVVPSSVLAAAANQQFVRSQLSRGHSSWERPAIYSLPAWLKRCWEDVRFTALDTPSLLSNLQERALWQQIIERDHRTLFDVSGMAQMAARAARLTAEWHIPLNHEAWADHEDASHFERWHEAFRQTCRASNWTTTAELWKLLPRWIANGKFPADAATFIGFENPVPALRSLVESRPELFQFESFPYAHPMDGFPARAFDTFAGELDYAARWARAMFEEQRVRSIAVFIPNLQQHAAMVRRSFQQVFYPSAALRTGARGVPSLKSSVFHIHAPASLIEHPLVAGALLMLELASPRIGVSEAGAILRSPFLAGAVEERSLRALAEVALRKKRSLDVSLQDVEWSSRKCPRLMRLWPGIKQVLKTRCAVGEFSYWSEFAGRLLKETGWPCDEDLSEDEQDVVDSWENALADLATLDLVCEPVTWNAAIRHLREMLPAGNETGSWDAPIQIFETGEAAGLQFEAAMLCGLSDECWPPRVEYGSPLIPLRLQRACGVPGSTPQSVRAERVRLTDALFTVAPILLASYARDSCSLHGFVDQKKSPLTWSGKTPWESFHFAEQEILIDSQAPPFVPDGIARGGTGLIRAQSQCPFRAFAEYRLRAYQLEDASLGMDPLARGTTLHKALEFVWRKLKTSDALQSMPPQELECLVKDAIHEAVYADESSSLRRVLTAVERERLKDLILEWLTVESARLQPFTVEFVEEKRAVDLAGLPLEVRLDRVDRLKTGHALLVDYKSGQQTKSKLQCPRPNEPQLLVYAATVDDTVDGVILAQVQARDCKAAGFTREKQFDRKTVEVKGRNWSEYLGDAKQEVFELATQFRSGWAAVDPSKGACEFCGSKPLCRILESAPTEREAE